MPLILPVEGIDDNGARKLTTEILQGDCRTVLATLADTSVHCCVTSPPYWGLRDYGTASWEGGDEGCDHVAQTMRTRESLAAWSAEHAAGGGHAVPESVQYRDICGKCGARRIDQQLGLEATPEQYVARMVEVFREVRRVLRDDGTLWLNLGDSYNNFRSQMGPGQEVHGRDKLNGKPAPDSRRRGTVGLKEKDLCGIPWRVAFALQADGWYLRQDIIWHKPNPMPESVTDRCTKAHEYIFLLAKSQRYYYDAEAIAEAVGTAPNAQSRGAKDTPDRGPRDGGNGGLHATAMRMRDGSVSTRNRRSVWTVTTKPYKGAHFATFPPKLIEPCILAGCPENGTVLDPFAGSGTTLAVAKEHNRNAIGIELNHDYIDLARRRVAAVQPRLL